MAGMLGRAPARQRRWGDARRIDGSHPHHRFDTLLRADLRMRRRSLSLLRPRVEDLVPIRRRTQRSASRTRISQIECGRVAYHFLCASVRMACFVPPSDTRAMEGVRTPVRHRPRRSTLSK